MAQRRVRKRTARPPADGGGPGLYQEIKGILIGAVGIWCLLSLAGKGGGFLGDALSHGLVALAGEAGAWVAAAALVWIGVYMIYLRFHERPFRWNRHSWGLLILFLSFELLV